MDRSAVTLYASVLDELRMRRGIDVPADTVYRLIYTLRATDIPDGETTFYLPRPVEYLFVPFHEPLFYEIFINRNGLNQAGDPVSFSLVVRHPRIDEVRVRWAGQGAGDVGRVLELFASDRPLWVRTFEL